MQDFKETIEKLKDILSKEKEGRILDKDVAIALGVPVDTFKKQKSNNHTPYLQVMQFLAKRKISINYFFFNQTPESIIESTSQYVLLKYNSLKGSAGGGAFNYTIENRSIILDIQLVSYLHTNPKYTQIMQTLGDSMYPFLQDSSLIFIDTSATNYNQKDVFVIDTKEGLFIKKIKYVNKKYYLTSINKEYLDIEVEEFKIIGKVTGVLNKI